MTQNPSMTTEMCCPGPRYVVENLLYILDQDNTIEQMNSNQNYQSS